MTQSGRSLLIGAIAMSAVAAFGQTQQETASLESDVVALEELLRAEIAASNAGDLEALLNLRTADAVEMLPEEPSLIGQDEIRAAWGADYPYIEKYTEISMDEINVIGDWGFMRFSYVNTMTPVSGGEPIVFIGRALWIVQRQPGNSWKIAREMANSDRPSD